MGRSTRWFLIAYLLCALTAWSNMLPVPSEPDLIFYINALGTASSGNLTQVEWSKLDQGTHKWKPYGELQHFVNFIHPPGAVLLGVLFDRIGARRCYLLALLSGALQHAIRAGAFSMGQLYLSKLPLVFRHTYLVTRTLIMQEASEEGRTRALAHASLAHTLGSALGIAAGADAVSKSDAHGGAALAVLLSLLALAVSFRLTRPPAAEPQGGTAEPTVLGRAAGTSAPRSSPPPRPSSLLPVPVAMLAWPTSREGLAKLLSRPVVYLLVAAKMGDAIASGVQDHSLHWAQTNEFKALDGYEPPLEATGRFWRLVALLLLIGPCSSRFRPRSFILMSMGYQALASLGIAAAFCPANPLTGLLPGPLLSFLLHAAVNVHSMASNACDIVLTTLLASAIVREERGTILGVDNFIFLLPPLVSPRLSAVAYWSGGVSGAYGVSCLLYAAIWLMIRHFILPRYHEKDG
mmetsp:Transcript_14313/g.39255  ORF Transcript_14313/g.39255 Transcript_14313/m.39255 type:complete len:463 (-) Transcript_14313:22-1410(-)